MQRTPSVAASLLDLSRSGDLGGVLPADLPVDRVTQVREWLPP